MVTAKLNHLGESLRGNPYFILAVFSPDKNDKKNSMKQNGMALLLTVSVLFWSYSP